MICKADFGLPWPISGVWCNSSLKGSRGEREDRRKWNCIRKSWCALVLCENMSCFIQNTSFWAVRWYQGPVFSQFLISQPPPPKKKKKHKPLGIYSPTQQTPPVAWRWCGLGVPRSGGGRSPTAACLPAPAASSSAALLRSHSGTGAAAVPGPPSVGTAGAGAAAPPLLCKICPPPTPPTCFLPREPSPIATPPPPLPHICAQVGVYRIPFCPPLNPCPPRDVPAVPSRGTDAPPLRHTLSPHQTRPRGETWGPSPSGVCFTPYFLTFCNSPPRSHQRRGGCCALGLQPRLRAESRAGCRGGTGQGMGEYTPPKPSVP